MNECVKYMYVMCVMNEWCIYSCVACMLMSSTECAVVTGGGDASLVHLVAPSAVDAVTAAGKYLSASALASFSWELTGGIEVCPLIEKYQGSNYHFVYVADDNIRVIILAGASPNRPAAPRARGPSHCVPPGPLFLLS